MIKKGCFGYIKQRRIIETGIALFFLALCLIMYYTGIKATGSNKNVLSIVAILGTLPMGKFAVTAIMFFKAMPCSKDLYDSLEKENLKPQFFDLYFTTYKKNYQISALSIKRQNIIAFSEDEKTNAKEAEDYIAQVVNQAGMNNVTVKVFKDKEKYFLRLKELETLEEDNVNRDFVKENILSVSI